MDNAGYRLPPEPGQEARQYKQREIEAKLELEAQVRAAREERGESSRGIRGALRRIRDALRRRG